MEQKPIPRRITLDKDGIPTPESAEFYGLGKSEPPPDAPPVFNAITISDEIRKAYLKAKARAISSGLNHSVFSHVEHFIIEGEEGETHIYFDVCARVKRIKP